MAHADDQHDVVSSAGHLALLRRAQQRAVENGKAFDITVELTHRCNMACRHCYIVPGEGELSLSQWLGILAQLAAHGVFVLTVTGGEPTVYTQFFEFLELATRFGFALRIFSNLTTLDEEDVGRLCEANILGIETTLHAADAETHDAFCRSPGAFDKTLRTLRLMKAKGLPLGLKTAWTRCNHKEPERMFRLAADLGLSLRGGPTVTPRRDGATDHLDCQLTEDELFDLFMKLTHLSGDSSRLASCEAYPVPDGNRGFCGAGITGVRISPSGKVYPCVEMRECVGRLLEQPFERIWNDAPLLKELRALRLRDAKECMACEDLRYCFRCPAYAVNEGFGLYGRAEAACRLARVNRRVAEALSEAAG